MQFPPVVIRIDPVWQRRVSTPPAVSSATLPSFGIALLLGSGAWRMHHGRAQSLSCRPQERPDHRAGAGQGQRAAGVNFADHLARVGLYERLLRRRLRGVRTLTPSRARPIRTRGTVLSRTRFSSYAEIAGIWQHPDAGPLPDSLSFLAGVDDGQLHPLHGQRCTATDRYVPVSACSSTRARRRRRRGHPSWRKGRRGVIRASPGQRTSSPSSASTACTGGTGGGRACRPTTSCSTLSRNELKRSSTCCRPGGRLVAYGFHRNAARRQALAAHRAATGVPMLRGFKRSGRRALSDSKAVMGLNMLRLWDEPRSAGANRR